MVVARQQVSDSDNQGDRSVDELECGQRGQAAVVGQLFGLLCLGMAQQLEVHGEGFAFRGFFHSLTLGISFGENLFSAIHLLFSDEDLTALLIVWLTYHICCRRTAWSTP